MRLDEWLSHDAANKRKQSQIEYGNACQYFMCVMALESTCLQQKKKRVWRISINSVVMIDFKACKGGKKKQKRTEVVNMWDYLTLFYLEAYEMPSISLFLSLQTSWVYNTPFQKKKKLACSIFNVSLCLFQHSGMGTYFEKKSPVTCAVTHQISLHLHPT